MSNDSFDLLIGPIGCLVTCAHRGPIAGEEMEHLSLIDDGAVGILGKKVVYVGRYADVSDYPSLARLDASGATVLPGFIDPHTHVPFLGDRSSELVMRLKGKSYMEIGRAGGGILSTMRNVRAASDGELLDAARRLSRIFLTHGVTSFEAKSGYGLDLESELKSLRALKALSKETDQLVFPTFLGAHFVPPEYRGREDEYVDLLCKELLPEVTRLGLATFCDVFCEEGAFTPAQAKKILGRGKELGLLPKIHADEIVDTGGASLAAEMGAVSADHLLAASPEGIRAMAHAGVCAVLLPGTAFYLRKPYAKARDFIGAGCPVAIASDCNPGSCFTPNILQIATLAVFGMGMMPEETIWAMTANAAYALRKQDEIGSIEAGKRADICIWDIPSPLNLFYPFGENPLRTVICGGKVAFSRN